MQTNNQKIVLSKNIYSIIAIKRALSQYVDLVYFNLNEDENNIIVNIECKNNEQDLNKIIKDINNSIIEEDVRCGIEIETKEIREMIYNKAINSSNGGIK